MKNGLKRYYVEYESETGRGEKKSYSVETTSQAKALNKVSKYVMKNGHHKSFNYGFTLSVEQSDKKADYTIN